MLRSFVWNIENKGLFAKHDQLLVAVSGGVDSMVLCDLLLKNQYHFSVAHCNFKLRDEDSDKDEAFVKEFCQTNHIPFYAQTFDTESYSKSRSLSIQMAARELRYNFFNELMKTHTFEYLLTAHHLNDNIETFFINLIRGTGINGLKGIESKNANLVRPLLEFSKEEILTYATNQHIAFREDRSNSEDKYLRNFIRLNIFPKFKELNPSFEDTIKKELELFEQYDHILSKHFDEETKQILEKLEDGARINIEKLLSKDSPELLLYEALKDYGFHSKSITQILNATKNISGKKFSSDSYELIKDREYLLIKKRSEIKIEEIYIGKDLLEINLPVNLKFEKVNDFVQENKINVAYIDSEKLKYPLKLRGWQTGDRFKPLGMTGFKKISDLFTDLKLNQFDKNKSLILENGNAEIIWVLNTRLDDRYKITDKTKHILRIEVIGK